MCSLRMTDIHLPGINSQRFRGTVSQGPVTAGDTATGRLTAMSTTGTPHLHLFKLTSPQGRPTKRKPTSTGRALAATVLLVSMTLSGNELTLGNLHRNNSLQVCPLTPKLCFRVKHIYVLIRK